MLVKILTGNVKGTIVKTAENMGRADECDDRHVYHHQADVCVDKLDAVGRECQPDFFGLPIKLGIEGSVEVIQIMLCKISILQYFIVGYIK